MAISLKRHPAAGLCLLLTACGQPLPPVALTAAPGPTYEADRAICEGKAAATAQKVTGGAAGAGAAGGAVWGGLTNGSVGGIAGNAAAGALIGAGTAQSRAAEAERAALVTCLQGRGHPVQ